MESAKYGAAILVGLSVVAACGAGGDEAESTTRNPPTSPSTTPDWTSPNSAVESDATTSQPASTPPTVPVAATVGATCEPVERLQIGERGCVEVRGGVVYIGDELFTADPPIVPYPGREWRRTDFPARWNVSILNDAPTDGDDWIIHDVIGRRIDEDTLRLTDVDGHVIADLIRDPTPIDERIVAG